MSVRLDPYLRKAVRAFAEEYFPDYMRYNEDEPDLGQVNSELSRKFPFHFETVFSIGFNVYL